MTDTYMFECILYTTILIILILLLCCGKQLKPANKDEKIFQKQDENQKEQNVDKNIRSDASPISKIPEYTAKSRENDQPSSGDQQKPREKVVASEPVALEQPKENITLDEPKTKITIENETPKIDEDHNNNKTESQKKVVQTEAFKLETGDAKAKIDDQNQIAESKSSSEPQKTSTESPSQSPPSPKTPNALPENESIAENTENSKHPESNDTLNTSLDAQANESNQAPDKSQQTLSKQPDKASLPKLPSIIEFSEEQKLTGLAQNLDSEIDQNSIAEFNSPEFNRMAHGMVQSHFRQILSFKGLELLTQPDPQLQPINDKLLRVSNDLQGKVRYLKNQSVIRFEVSVVGAEGAHPLSVYVTPKLEMYIHDFDKAETEHPEYKGCRLVRSGLSKIKSIQTYNKSVCLGDNADIVAFEHINSAPEKKVSMWLSRVYSRGKKIDVSAITAGTFDGSLEQLKSNGQFTPIDCARQPGYRVDAQIDENKQTLYFTKTDDNVMQYVTGPGGSFEAPQSSGSQGPERLQECPAEIASYSDKMQSVCKFIKFQKRIHFILMLDQSNSIKEDGHLEDITSATRSFLKKLKQRQRDTGQKILISVIYFSHKFHIRVIGQSIAKLKLNFLNEFMGGSTNFRQPLEQSIILYNNFKDKVDVTLFYLFTDGNADIPNEIVPDWHRLLRKKKHFVQLRLVSLVNSISLKKFDEKLETPSCIYFENVSIEALFDNIKQFIGLQ